MSELRDMMEMTGEELLAEMQELSVKTPLSPQEMIGANSAFNRVIFKSLYGEIIELRNQSRLLMNSLTTGEEAVLPLEVAAEVAEFEGEMGMVQLVGLVGLLRAKQGSKLTVIGGD